MNLPPKVTDRAFARLAEIGAADQGQALRVAAPGWVRPRRARVFLNGVEVAAREIDAEPGAPTDVVLPMTVAAPPHDAHLVCVVVGDGVRDVTAPDGRN